MENKEIKEFLNHLSKWFECHKDDDLLEHQNWCLIDCGYYRMRDKYRNKLVDAVTDAFYQEFRDRNEAQGIEENGGKPVPD